MTISVVQVAHQTLYAVMPVIPPLQQMPVEAGVVVPFTALGKLVTHKQQLLTREGPHPAIVGAQIGKLLPRIARHAVEDRFFTVHHFIV
ncbi:hypothetical protein D3C81_1897550 [compost metagenome]